VLVTAFSAVAALPSRAAAQNGRFSATGSLTEARKYHTATLLSNGKVLIAGGWIYDLTTELYDPMTGTFTASAPMSASGGGGHTATLLPTGDVLVTGGFVPYDGSAAAELYHPATETFSMTASMSVKRVGHTATFVPLTRKVLIAGGDDGFGGITWKTAELYDPATGAFSSTKFGMNTERQYHTATLLPDGKVLVAGGWHYDAATECWPVTASAEIYDPQSGKFTATTDMMRVRRVNHSATLLGNGKVLIAGGHAALGGTCGDGTPTATAELFDPEKKTFTPTGSMLVGRTKHTATLLPTGKVLIAGGYTWDGGTGDWSASAEVYDPTTGTFASVPPMNSPRAWFTATPLGNGRVLMSGGEQGDRTTATADLYGDPLLCY
jgi:WD40 repeat protein